MTLNRMSHVPMMPSGNPLLVEDDRPGWDVFFMREAANASTRATCLRKRVGAVIVQGHDSVMKGYNGSPEGQPHCTQVGCEMENGHCVRTIHAEANALLRAARRGVQTQGATLYVTASPCLHCFKLSLAAGIKRVVYGEFYRDERIEALAAAAGIELVDLTPPKYCGTCDACELVKEGCGCDGALDDGCFLCSSDRHPRPPCPSDAFKANLSWKERGW